MRKYVIFKTSVIENEGELHSLQREALLTILYPRMKTQNINWSKIRRHNWGWSIIKLLSPITAISPPIHNS